MKRRTAARAALIATPLVAFMLYAALNWFRIVEDTQWVGMGAEAQREPYLAYSRLLARMGARAKIADMGAALEPPPERGRLVLGANRLVYMTAGRVERLVGWVRRGGTLVVEAERRGVDDPLLEAFQVEREGDKPEHHLPTTPRSTPRAPVATDFDWKGNGEKLRMDLGPGAEGLLDRGARHEVQAARAQGRNVALAFAEGEGRVVVLSSLAFLRNGSIGDHDHAEMGLQLATPEGPHAALLYLLPADASLTEWLAREAWPALVAAGAFLALWLARVVPRFGPVAPEPPPARRRISEHIAASGRFLWSRGEGAYLLEAARERVWRTASRRFGRPAAPDAPGALDKVADAAGASRQKAQRALRASAPGDRAFLEAVKALQEIDAALGRRGPNRLSTKETT